MLGTEMINRNVLNFDFFSWTKLDFWQKASFLFWSCIVELKSQKQQLFVLVLPQTARLVSTSGRNKINHCMILLRLRLKMLLSRYYHHLLSTNESVNSACDFSECSCLFILFSSDFLFNILCNSNAMELRNSSITETAPHAPAWILHLH